MSVMKDSIIKKGLRYLCARHFLNFLPDRMYLKILYWACIGKKLDLDAPQTFNEKLQWLKLYDRKPEYTMMVDKYEVKKYIADIIGEKYIIPTLGVWNSFDEIDFDALPQQFVLKCTHDSGGIVICKDKSELDISAARTKIENSLKKNYYKYGREWPYKNVKPRIIAEKYMDTSDGQQLVDYKIMCFNGKAKCLFICTDRYSDSGLKVTFFDRDWNKLPFERHYPSDHNHIIRPKNLELMFVLAEKISKEMKFVRIDFYEVHDRVFFGEITFFPGSGIEEFTPAEWDLKLGSWISLTKEKE